MRRHASRRCLAGRRQPASGLRAPAVVSRRSSRAALRAAAIRSLSGRAWSGSAVVSRSTRSQAAAETASAAVSLSSIAMAAANASAVRPFARSAVPIAARTGRRSRASGKSAKTRSAAEICPARPGNGQRSPASGLQTAGTVRRRYGAPPRQHRPRVSGPRPSPARRTVGPRRFRSCRRSRRRSAPPEPSGLPQQRSGRPVVVRGSDPRGEPAVPPELAARSPQARRSVATSAIAATSIILHRAAICS